MTDRALWRSRAEAATAALLEHYWDPRRGLFRVTTARRLLSTLGPWHYWWQAHALDAVVDAYVRSGDSSLADLAGRHTARIVRRNGGTVVNNYYDDMAWMGLALHRATAAGLLDASRLVTRLLDEIRAGRDAGSGVVVWRRGDDFRNVPANAPTAILAARCGDQPLAEHLVGWLHAALVHPRTAEVWDGIRGGVVSRDAHTYNYGTVVGADVALHALTGDIDLLHRARRVAVAAVARLAPDGVLVEEGGGDGGLFKGILARYLADLVEASGDPELRDFLVHNATAAWDARTEDGLFGPDWRHPPQGAVDLSVHLSGVLLVEAVARVVP